MTKRLALAGKIILSVGILTYLVASSLRGDAFARLLVDDKRWHLLLLAIVFSAAAPVLTMVRWWHLGRAVGLGFSLRDALRLGFVGYLFNLAPMGVVGGDAVKAVLLARQHRGNAVKAVATVAIDRVVGLYMLLVVASVAILVGGYWRLDVPSMRAVCRSTLVLTTVGGLGLMTLFLPGVLESRLATVWARLPGIGRHWTSLLEALRLYRGQPRALLEAAAMSVVVHTSFATGVYFVARGLPGDVHAWSTHMMMLPVAGLAGVLPVPAGPFEWVLENLYAGMAGPCGVAIVAGQGLIVALAYRLITLGVAGVGLAYYLTARREIDSAVRAEAALAPQQA